MFRKKIDIGQINGLSLTPQPLQYFGTDINGILGYNDIPSSGVTLTFENGLTLSGDTVSLGGELVNDTIIFNSENNDFTIQTKDLSLNEKSVLLNTNISGNTYNLLSFNGNEGVYEDINIIDIFLGLNSGNNNSNIGGGNVGIGSNTLKNVESILGNPFSGNRNIVIGNNAGSGITTSNSNIVIGDGAFISGTTSSFNSYIGFQIARNNIGTGGSNVGLGQYVFENITGGTSNFNIGIGASAFRGVRHIGTSNIAIGANSFNNTNWVSGTTNISNIGIGSSTFQESENGHQNCIAIGSNGGRRMKSTASRNTVIGAQAGTYMGGSNNTSVGSRAGFSNNGNGNTFIGFEAGHTTGNNYTNQSNIGTASSNLFAGTNTTFIGYRAGYDVSGLTLANTIIIGTNWQGASESNTTYLASPTNIKLISNTNSSPNEVLTLNNSGATYNMDYSPVYTNRSLVDKQYVDDRIVVATVALDSTGSVINFDRPRTYGTDLAPIIATTLTDSNTGATKVVQKIYHQAASFTPPASWVKLRASGEYEVGVLNIIYVEYARDGRKEYSITQDA